MHFLKHQVWGLATFVSQHTTYCYYYYFYNSDDFPSGENCISYTDWVKSCWLHQCLCDYWFSNCGFGDKSQQLMRRWSRGQTEGGGELLPFKRQGRKPAADSNHKHCINMMCVYVCVRALHLHVRSFGCCSWADLMLRRGSVISIHRGIKH